MKLHLGCGSKKLEGWVNIDSVPDYSPDLVHNLRNRLPYENNSVDEVLAEDILEHFDKYERYFIFFDWIRVLKLNGTITVQVPNFRAVLFKGAVKSILGRTTNILIDFIYGETMFNSKYYTGHYGIHKFAYTWNSLTNFMTSFGLTVYERKKSGNNLRFTASKRLAVSFANVLEKTVWAPANEGDGDNPYLKLKDIYEEYKKFHGMK